MIYRFDGPLIFANANIFKAEVRHLAHAEPPPAWIIVAAEPITAVDTTAADMLEELDAELEALGISFVFAEMKDAVRNEIRHYGMTWMADRDAFYPTIGTAVKAYRQLTGIPKPGHEPGHDPHPERWRRLTARRLRSLRGRADGQRGRRDSSRPAMMTATPMRGDVANA